MKTAVSIPDRIFRAADAQARRPVLIVQSDPFNRSRIRTVVALSPNVRLAEAPGNVAIPAAVAGLPKDSVANVSRLVTFDRATLAQRAARLPPRLMRQIDEALRLVLGI